MARTRQTARSAPRQSEIGPGPPPGRNVTNPAVPDSERKRSVTSKSNPQPTPNRGSPKPADGMEAKLQEVVSVRFTDDELKRIQAYAVIFGTTPNAVIREACRFFLSQKVGAPDYHKALEAYRVRTNEVVDVLEQINSA
jgi:hypothetical protein